MSDRDYLYGHVCAHGSLARSCQVCDLEDEVCDLEDEARRLRDERSAMLDALEAVQAAVATEVYDGAVYCRSCGSWVDADTCLAAEARTKIARVYTLIGGRR